MYIDRVSIKGFRNLAPLSLTLSQGLNLFYGGNAQGKTNFLEAVYICSTGRSQRANTDREMVEYSEESAYIQAFVNTPAAPNKISVHLNKSDKKRIAINGFPIKKLGQLFGNLLTVIFSPEDLQLIKAGPSERRRFMDVGLCQLSAVYYHELQQYHRVLKQRNNLLKSIRMTAGLRDTIAAWDEQLATRGIKIIEHRTAFAEELSLLAREAHAKLTNEREELSLIYRPSTSPDDFSERLKRGLERDIALGSTSTGTHKDDISFQINGEDARVYGSQGQQRTAALAAKLAEVGLMTKRKQTSPVLLLDDVLSELDDERQNCLIRGIEGIQTVMTSTCADVRLPTTAVYRVENGEIINGTSINSKETARGGRERQ
ncbi:MAG: DNA replication/repair protein RecF [Defluviitaleaceae bacterium]|nr:DNA replication/repair protein RecF [Defluviitaleaceae bacterium]